MTTTPRSFCPPGQSKGTGRRFEKRRPNANARGYGRRWRKFVAAYLQQHPLCSRCLDSGRTTRATLVHHKRPVTGPRDPGFYERGNHAGLCHDCHEVIHGRRRDNGIN